MKKHFRWLGLTCICLLLGGAAGGGLAFYYYHYDQNADNLLRGGEAAFQQGRQAMARNDFPAAQQEFHKALVITEKLFEELERERGELKEPKPEVVDRFRQKEGQAFWLKMRVLRGHSLAKAMAAGKKLPAVEGAAADQPLQLLTVFPVTHLPDEEQRKEAVVCLRQAALRLVDNEEILREAVAVEIQMDPLQWQLVQIFAGNLLQEKMAPRDDRARYLMARLEFEQPLVNPTDPGTAAQPTPPARRSRERMLTALDHVNKLKAIERTPRWRTLILEAQIHAWLMESYRRPESRKPNLEQQEEQALRTLLFDDSTGALARAAREGEGANSRLPGLSRLDFEGVLGLHQIALDLVIDDCRRASHHSQAPTVAGTEAVQKSMEAITNLMPKLLGKNPAGSKLGRCAELQVYAMVRAQPFLAKERPEVWKSCMTAAREMVRQANAKNAGQPTMYLKLADILARESELAGKAGDAALQAELRKQATTCIDEGIKAGQARKLSAPQMVALHETAARLKALSGGKWADLLPHLQVMRESGLTTSRATSYLLEGAYAEREGRLEKAREALEKAVQLVNRGDTARRAHTVLAHLYLALGQPDRALASLREVERIYEQWEQLSEEEKTWVFEFIRGPKELAYLQVQAHLACAGAKHRLVGHVKTPKEARDLLLVVQQHEQEAQRLHGQFPARSPLERSARLQWVKYFAGTQRFDMAEQELAILRRDYPENLQVFKMEVNVRVAKTRAQTDLTGAEAKKLAEATVKQMDERIQQFIRDYPQEFAARLYWVEWLLGTGRSDQATAYLEDPANFPGSGDDPRYNRLRSVVHLMKGDVEKTKDALQNMPRDPLVDVALIQAAGGMEEKQKQIAEAMNRYERNGLFRCWNAGLAFARKDYAEAAREYLRALECTQVKKAARQGLRDALLAFSREDPDKARILAVQLLQDYPAEPGLLLGFAHACLLLGQIGNPADRAEQIKDMATALNALEAVYQMERQEVVLGPLTKAQFWLLAQMPERARPEVQRALEMQPKYEPALLLAVQLCSSSDDPVIQAQAARHIQTLRELKPNAPVPQLLQAQLKRREGKADEAVQMLTQLLQANPKFSAGYAAQADLLFQIGDLERATTVVRTWCEECPQDLAARTAQIRVHAVRGQLPQARQVLDSTLALLEREPTTGPRQVKHTEQEGAKVAIILTLAQGLMQGQAVEEAEKWLQRVLEIQPNNEAAYLFLGEIHLYRMAQAKEPSQRRMHAAQARDAFSQVYKQRKGHFVAGNNLAWLLAAELRDPEEAYRIAVEVRQNRYTKAPVAGDQLPASFLDTFGLIYDQLARPQQAAEARDLFEAARKRYPQDARMYLYLGQAYGRLRDQRKAEQMLATAAALAQPKARSPLSPQEKQAVLAAVQKAQRQLGTR
jgi:tetratricopeptide (TPR) repeat protein